MPSVRQINYARVTAQRVAYDVDSQTGEVAVNYVVGSSRGLVLTDYANAGFLSSAVLGFSGSACVSAVFAAVGALMASQEGLDPSQGDLIIF